MSATEAGGPNLQKPPVVPAEGPQAESPAHGASSGPTQPSEVNQPPTGYLGDGAWGGPTDTARLSHVDEHGAARMVDVSMKTVTVRTARAAGRVTVSPEVVGLLRGRGVPKGDALAVARLAGIQGAKRTPDLIPLCHPIALHGVEVGLEVNDDAVEIEATVRTADRTGVEMEALTAVATAGLALIDMVKAVDRNASIENIRLLTKTGGRSGDWRRS